MTKIKTIATIIFLTLILFKSHGNETIKSVDSILYKSYITENKNLSIEFMSGRLKPTDS
jgi:hypothetical protein